MRRIIAFGALTAVALLALAGPASAHVTVAADDATRAAEDAILTFRVPNEKDNAVTTKVDIVFPTKNPIASVKASPKPGWTVTMKTVKFDPPIKTDDGTITDGVGEVTYTATSAATGIPVGQFERFEILVGPLPDAATVSFPTVQTYSNGEKVAWVEPMTDPANMPESPVPTLDLTAKADAASEPSTGVVGSAVPSVSASAASTGVDPASVGQAGASTSEVPATKSDVSTGRTFGLTGIVLGALGLAAGLTGLVRSRRTIAA